MNPRSRISSSLRKLRLDVASILVLLISVAIAILVIEIAARRLYSPPWYDKLAKAQQQAQTYPYRKNSDGLRDRAYSSPKPAPVRRVLILGDSFTFGLGVFRDEATFPKILERRLNETTHIPGLQRIEVLNGGIPGSLTGDWLQLWSRVGKKFDPDVVLIVFFLRDGTPLSSMESFFGPIQKRIVERNRQSLLYQHLFAYRILRDQIDRLVISRHYQKRFYDAYFGDEKETAEWQLAQYNVREIRDLAQRRSAITALVVFPILYQLDKNYPFQGICDLLDSFGRANAMPVHDLLPAFVGKRDMSLWVSPQDQHPNERAHAIAAESLLPFTIRLLQAHERMTYERSVHK